MIRYESKKSVGITTMTCVNRARNARSENGNKKRMNFLSDDRKSVIANKRNIQQIPWNNSLIHMKDWLINRK
jgi:hypothetical protein